MQSFLKLDTPALLVDKAIMEQNIFEMMKKAQQAGVKLRPHTKTHRTPEVARRQVMAGAAGITVAKVGEAEVMAAYGLTDIFIANQIFGEQKFLRLREIHRKVKVAVGVDNREQIEGLSRVFGTEPVPLDVLIEIETGEERTGVLPGEPALALARLIMETPGLKLRGLFSHEGHAYGASSPEACRDIFRKSQQDTLDSAHLLQTKGIAVDEVSIGSTPSLMHGEILPGITEIRPGTYVYMDAAQGSCIQDYSKCALTVLATVISKPVQGRVVVDAGVKALTAFTRAQGICHTPGHGIVKELGTDIRLKKLYDEHGIIIGDEAYAKLEIGEKISIIPNHACPTCNLYDKIYMVENGFVAAEWPILCRGKSQ